MEPRRTEANVRYYEDDDLRKILKVALLNKRGMRISRIADLSERQRTEKIASLPHLSISETTPLDALTLSILDLDARKFNHIIDANIAHRGFEETMLEVIYPFLSKLNLLHFTGSVSSVHELFVSQLIRQKILVATEALPAPPADRPALTFALYLPPGERQELSLLFVQYLLLKSGLRVIYLGPDVAPALLGEALRLVTFDSLLTIIPNTFVHQSVGDHFREVLRHCPSTTLYVTGRGLPKRHPDWPAAVRTVKGLREVREMIVEITAGR